MSPFAQIVLVNKLKLELLAKKLGIEFKDRLCMTCKGRGYRLDGPAEGVACAPCGGSGWVVEIKERVDEPTEQ